MGTISSAFNLISGALNADQSALEHRGQQCGQCEYARVHARDSQLAGESIRSASTAWIYGTGVSQTGATSMRDRVLTERLNQQQQLAAASGARLAALNAMQALFTPDSGAASARAGDIGSDITQFLQFVLIPRSESHQQCAAAAGAVDGNDPGGGYFQCRRAPELRSARRWTRRRRE